jgi:hypothetical protein
MAGYGNSYESLMKKNCGYRQLGTYYKNLFNNLTDPSNPDQNIRNAQQILVVPEFGGVPYNNINPNSVTKSKDMVAGIKCDTWRSGGCCDSRSLNKNAYTQCPSGLCPGYSAANTSLNSRY